MLLISGFLIATPSRQAVLPFTLTNIHDDHSVEVTFRMKADLNGDGTIDWRDLRLMCENWLSTDPNALGNLNGDNIVNFLDYAEFALKW